MTPPGDPEREEGPTLHVREAAPLIAASAVNQTYLSQDRSVVAALTDITLDVAPGEFVTIVGPSGCGKTTLLRIMAGLLRPTGGSVHLLGRPVTGPSRNVGVVFQDPVLLPWRTVLDNVMLPVQVLGLDVARYRMRALELLALVGLTGFERKYPHELSGGMRQRVSLARALVHDPALLLMDEPFGALDAMTREAMNLELQRIWQESGKTVTFITHSISEAVFLGDRVVVMSPRPGRITDVVTVELGRPRDLDLMASDAFGVYTRKIRQALGPRGLLE
ncbi:MAG TPA: ABC transporter ATP-binding protein [Methylomirabilota bacterium]|nr:ABC transporter ATP-binding protein [Methylomirabilota bacterium]